MARTLPYANMASTPWVKVAGDSFVIHKLEYYYSRLLFENEIALFLDEVWGRSGAFDEELARNPHYPPHLGSEVMVPRDNNSTLAFNTELLKLHNCFCHPREKRAL